MISVIIPTFNRQELVIQAISSVLAQKVSDDYEIIVVDDGSLDDTAEIIRRKFPKVKLIQQANQGVSTARNVGVANAQYEYIAFCDSDDLMLPGRLELQKNYLISNKKVVCVSGNYLNFSLCGGVRFPQRFDHKPFCIQVYGKGAVQNYYKTAPKVENPFISTGMLRKEAFIKQDGFREYLKKCEDIEFIARLHVVGDLAVIDQPLMLVRSDNHQRLSQDHQLINWYERMLDAWLHDAGELVRSHAGFRSHVQVWAGHVVLREFSSRNWEEMTRLYQKYNQWMLKSARAKYHFASKIMKRYI